MRVATVKDKLQENMQTGLSTLQEEITAILQENLVLVIKGTKASGRLKLRWMYTTKADLKEMGTQMNSVQRERENEIRANWQ